MRFGTNLYAHVLRGRLMRMVPRENEEINETWIADRDRFGFEGMYSPERVTEPMVRIDGVLQCRRLGSGADRGRGRLAEASPRQSAAASSGSSPRRWPRVEELYLLARIARGLGCAQHRSSAAPAGFLATSAE